MSPCRLIQSRAQRPVGRSLAAKPLSRQHVAPASAVGANEQGGPDTQPAQAVGTIYEAPPAYPLYQPQPYQQTSPVAPLPPPPAPVVQNEGTPFWVWILVGAAAAWVFGKIQEFRNNPAAAMMGMMGSMNKGNAAAGGGNDMAAMMEMMKKMQGAPGAGGAPGFGGQAPFGGMGSPGMTIPTTAQEVSSSGRDGSKFEQNKQGAPSSSAAESPAPQSQPANTASTAPPTVDTSATSSTSTPSSFFDDASASASAPAAAASQAAPSPDATAASFFSDSGAAAAAPANAEGGEGTEKLIENMLEMVVNNPELQQQMNKFLPENMRNESTWKWMANSPELRKQIAAQMAPNFNMSDFQGMPGGDASSSPEMQKVQPLHACLCRVGVRCSTSQQYRSALPSLLSIPKSMPELACTPFNSHHGHRAAVCASPATFQCTQPVVPSSDTDLAIRWNCG